MYLSDIGFEEAVLLWKRSISPSLAREIALHPVCTKFGRQEVKLTNHLANLSQDSCERMCADQIVVEGFSRSFLEVNVPKQFVSL